MMYIVFRNYDLIWFSTVFDFVPFSPVRIQLYNTENSENSGIIVNVSRGQGPQKYGRNHENAIQILGNPTCARNQ